MYEFIRFEEDAGIARLTLSRPKSLNALHIAALQEIEDALAQVKTGRFRALVVAAEGRAFCAGLDLGSDELDQHHPLVVDAGSILETHFNPLLLRIYALPLPVLCVVNGVAAGAGCSIALAGDIVIAARSAYFLQAFVNIGLAPDVGSTWILPRLIGKARAQAMMMLGEKVPAERAAEWGMIYAAVDDDALSTTSQLVAQRLAAGPTLAYQLIRQGMRMALESGLEQTLAVERANQAIAGKSQDFIEGVSAFRQKRSPRFSGA